ncbi:hypothetical protein LXJ58_06635 [Escherichia coli]|nr:hypothetical protein [Escherichia coli]
MTVILLLTDPAVVVVPRIPVLAAAAFAKQTQGRFRGLNFSSFRQIPHKKPSRHKLPLHFSPDTCHPFQQITPPPILQVETSYALQNKSP